MTGPWGQTVSNGGERAAIEPAPALPDGFQVHEQASVFDRGPAQWRDALLVAKALAVDPRGLGGVHVRANAGPAREAFLSVYKTLQGDAAPFITCPATADAETLFGGLDPAVTLAKGRPAYQDGVLARADGGALVVRGAERLRAGSAGAIAQALDIGAVHLERGERSGPAPAAFAAILLDEGADADEIAPPALCERLAFAIDLSCVSWRDCRARDEIGTDEIRAARRTLHAVRIGDDLMRAILAAAQDAGVEGLRPQIFCFRATRAFAALSGRAVASVDDAALACRLVLRPRPAPDDAVPPEAVPPDAGDPQAPAPDAQDGDEQKNADAESHDAAGQSGDLSEIMIAASKAGLIHLEFAKPARRRRHVKSLGDGKSGATTRSFASGRAIGAGRRGGRQGGKINVLETLKAAAPWQVQRARDASAPATIRIRPEDLRITHFEKRLGSSVIFVVDASGSAAVERLSETKGAIERLLQDCYSRRDYVSVIAFRGDRADILLPPTNALLRAKRALSSLPGGGGTPLASGLLAAEALADRENARGRTPFLVVLSDGGANIDKTGAPGRKTARADAEEIARRIGDMGHTVLFFDTGRRPSPAARALADSLGAAYRPLPYGGPYGGAYGGGASLSGIVAGARERLRG